MASHSILKCFIFVVFSINLGYGFGLQNVRNMKVNPIDKLLHENSFKSMPIKILSTPKKLLNGLINQNSMKMPFPKLGGAFKWNTCNKSQSIINLQSLGISPDPVLLPGNVNFQFTAIVKETIDAPLKVNVTLKKQITPSFWITIPCISGIGSCVYDDLCETLAGAVCPDPFVKYNIPCKCPFSKGNYKMQKSAVDINFADFPPGYYYGKADITYNGQSALCLEIYVELN